MELTMGSAFKNLLQWYFSKRTLPYWCVLIADCFIVFFSGVLTYWLFNKTMIMIEHRFDVLYTLVVYVVLSMLSARVFSTYSGILRYSSFVDLLHVAYANLLTIVLALIVSFTARSLGWFEFSALTKTETVTMFFLSTLLMGALRVLIKALYDVSTLNKLTRRALVYGTLSGGIGLAKYIQSQRPRHFSLEGFITHEKTSSDIRLMGKHIYSDKDDLATIIREKRISAVLVSPLRLSEFRNNQELQNVIINAGCKIYMVQAAREASIKDGQIAADDMSSMQLKEVSVEDLLPRQEIHVDMASVGKQLRGRRILITGAAGSIGSEIVRQTAQFQPASMMLIDQAETPEHDVQLMMQNEYPDVNATTLVADICDKKRMDYVFRSFRPDYVFHAAAYKHVPMMEDNPSEAVLNNIRGTKYIADLSVKYGVSKFVMVSTDKAVNPTNVMGCSKRICEIYVQSLDAALKSNPSAFERSLADGQKVVNCQFVTTRFGNVLGSSGSVIPLFRKQILEGGPVTVTHPDIIRYFMLIPEACQLVLEAGTKGNGGEIFVFDMGKPVRIADLARRMIQLSGATDVEVKFTGLRSGEKLYEEVLSDMENTKPSFHEKIRIAEVRQYNYEQVCKEIDELVDIARRYDNMETVRKMKQIVPEYKSNNSIYEQLDAKK